MELRSEAQMDLTLDLDDKSKFQAVVIYEDGSTGRRAKHFYDKLVHELEDECAFSLQLWSFQVLAIPELRELAVESAAQADFVILSLHGKAGLPLDIREWIETWSKLIIGKGPALIALVDKSTTRDGTNASALAYLKRIAKRTKVDFFGHTFFNLLGTGKEFTMSIASIEGRRPRKVEKRLRFPDQTKAIGSEESDEHVLLGDLIRFVENSDKSIPRIAELMGVSGVTLSMWIAGTARPPATKLLEIKRFFERTAPPQSSDSVQRL